MDRGVEISVRLATPAEFKTCLDIRREVFIEEQSVPATLERDAYDDTALHFLIFRNDTAVGTARVIAKDQGRTGKIGRVAIRKMARGGGIGRQLMQGVEAALMLRGFRQLILEAQIHALAFYEKLGYVAEGDEFMDAGILHRSMRKILLSAP